MSGAQPPTGRVTLVGGGPGDPELMTVGALAALAAADVVLYDRLGPRADLRQWAPRAELVDVGKRPGHHAVPQEEINALLVSHALAGRDAVRLKGGDPFVFGRGGEEVAACRARGIPVRVIPGVTSAIAVPASSGIPVTYRELSRAFTVVSGHAPLSDDELSGLVRLGGTVVILMGVTNLPNIGAGLLRNGMSERMPFAIVERGFTSDARVITGMLGQLTAVLQASAPRSPAVIVIGEVAAFATSGELTEALAEAGA